MNNEFTYYKVVRLEKSSIGVLSIDDVFYSKSEALEFKKSKEKLKFVIDIKVKKITEITEIIAWQVERSLA